jgi:hypothetical protein
MLPQNTDVIALRAQADIERFYSRVVHRTLADLVAEEAPTGGVTLDMDVFLEAARIGTQNALCAEARMALALTMGAAFERHLRLWLVNKLPGERTVLQREPGWTNVVARVSALAQTDMASLPITLDVEELWLLVSAVRHGDGSSCTSLQKKAPGLWAHLMAEELDQANSEGVASFNMLVADGDLARYAHAILSFWGYLGASPLGGGGGRRGFYVPMWSA